MPILPLSETLLQKFDGCKSPVVVDVKSSVIFEVCFRACQLPLMLICFWASMRMSYHLLHSSSVTTEIWQFILWLFFKEDDSRI